MGIQIQFVSNYIFVYRGQQVITERQTAHNALADLMRGDFKQGRVDKADFCRYTGDLFFQYGQVDRVAGTADDANLMAGLL